MNLIDTIHLMASADYKDRFRAEYIQTRTRYLKLVDMVNKWDKGELGFNPDCPRVIYEYQLKAMKKYLDILEIRAKMEDIDLLMMER